MAASNGVNEVDVWAAADQVLRKGHKPTIARVRKTLGRGSPNTVNPMLGRWWKSLAGRLEGKNGLPDEVIKACRATYESMKVIMRPVAIEEGQPLSGGAASARAVMPSESGQDGSKDAEIARLMAELRAELKKFADTHRLAASDKARLETELHWERQSTMQILEGRSVTEKNHQRHEKSLTRKIEKLRRENIRLRRIAKRIRNENK